MERTSVMKDGFELSIYTEGSPMKVESLRERDIVVVWLKDRDMLHYQVHVKNLVKRSAKQILRLVVDGVRDTKFITVLDKEVGSTCTIKSHGLTYLAFGRMEIEEGGTGTATMQKLAELGRIEVEIKSCIGTTQMNGSSRGPAADLLGNNIRLGEAAKKSKKASAAVTVSGGQMAEPTGAFTSYSTGPLEHTLTIRYASPIHVLLDRQNIAREERQRRLAAGETLEVEEVEVSDDEEEEDEDDVEEEAAPSAARGAAAATGAAIVAAAAAEKAAEEARVAAAAAAEEARARAAAAEEARAAAAAAAAAAAGEASGAKRKAGEGADDAGAELEGSKKARSDAVKSEPLAAAAATSGAAEEDDEDGDDFIDLT